MLPTPKVSSQDSHYARKLKTNLFGIYCANEDIIHCFFYDKTIGGCGPNEVVSLLSYLLKILHEKYGPFHHLILWSDNSPSQFKECYLFFFLEYLIKEEVFLRIDLKFLLEGHSYSICDRRFGCIQKYFDCHETIETPQDWELILRNSHLSNVKSYWITPDCIMDYKSFLRRKYVSRSEDVENAKLEVRKIAFLNFGYGEMEDEEGNLRLCKHTETTFVRFTLNTREKPRIVSFVKKKQAGDLNPDHLVPVTQERKAIRDDVKQSCLKLAEKYLSQRAITFYASLIGTSRDNDDGES